MPSDVQPFALIGAALLVFLLSTRRFPVGMRAIIWVCGIGLLVWAWMGRFAPADLSGLYDLVADAARNQSQSALWVTANSNWRSVAGALAPMFDVFFFLAAGLGLLALFAFSPGEEMERGGRPLSIGLFGAVIGGFIALALAAAGFGLYPKRQVYLAAGHPVEVVDGDTIRMGDVTLRLAGIDAPEFHRRDDAAPDARNQFCFDAEDAQAPCGENAYAALAELVREVDWVICARVAEQETFVLVRCTVRTPGGGAFDLAQRLAQQGYAAAPEEEARIEVADYSADIANAAEAGAHLWAGCTLKPSVWRNAHAREDFRARRFERIAEGDFIGRDKCPPPAEPPAPAPPRRRPRS